VFNNDDGNNCMMFTSVNETTGLTTPSQINQTYISYFNTIIMNHINIIDTYPLVYWTEYNNESNMLYYYISIATTSNGDDIFTVNTLINSQTVPNNFYNIDYHLNIIVLDTSILYATIIEFVNSLPYISFVYSTDAGATWSMPSQIISLGSVLNQDVVEGHSFGTLLYDGIVDGNPTLIAFIWNSIVGFVYSSSTDSGLTWTPPLLIDNSGEIIDVDILVTQDGKLFIVYNRNNLDGTYDTVTLSEQQFIISNFVNYRIRRGIPQISGRAVTDSIVSATPDTITFSTTSSSDNIYEGMYLWIYNDNVGTVPLDYHSFNNTYIITNYDGDTKTATVSTILPDLDILALPPGTNNVNWEILGSIKDCFNGLDYFNSQLLVERCYRITLNHIILPNKLLETGIGNQISFYPYVYVKLIPISNHIQKSFFSNNPHASSVSFKVPVSQFTSDPGSLPFIRLSSGTQIVVRLNPSLGFHFSVYLPNGDLFTTLEKDTISPDLPNPLLQISAEFEFSLVN